MNSINFLNLLIRNEEFVFEYNNVKYEIIYENGGLLNLYLCNPETLLGVYRTHEDFLNNCFIEGEKVLNIAHKIIV